LRRERRVITAVWRKILMADQSAWIVRNIQIFQCGRINGRDRVNFPIKLGLSLRFQLKEQRVKFRNVLEHWAEDYSGRGDEVFAMTEATLNYF
jgi:hypothetical protein